MRDGSSGSFGLGARLVQCNISYNRRKGTLRGMHYQVPPFEEDKLVRCTRGAIHDVIIDLRPEFETFGKHIGVTLTAENRTMLHIPKGFAHGFLTLEDDTEVHYQMSEFYAPECARGFAGTIRPSESSGRERCGSSARRTGPTRISTSGNSATE